MSEAKREMTLAEWVATLPHPHLVRTQFAELVVERDTLRAENARLRDALRALLDRADAQGFNFDCMDAARSALGDES